jgi:hypothetical protein
MAASIGGASLVFGPLWIVMVSSLTKNFDTAFFGSIPQLFPLFGVAFIVAGVGYAAYIYHLAVVYREAKERYLERRAKLMKGEIDRAAN